MKEIEDEEVRDAALIAAAQGAEHYEISRYGTLVAWAELLGHDALAKTFRKTLEEEKAADATLSSIAMSQVNRMAA
jgi:ferritin-like metal-binding protein YciE